jgi:hypothetical protein
MGRTLTVRIDDELDAWLAAAAKQRGVSKGKVVRDQLETGRGQARQPAFMRLAGAVSGRRDLSKRKGFSKG